MKIHSFIFAALLALWSGTASADGTLTGGVKLAPVIIATGGTFQQILGPAGPGSDRHSITFQNNNKADSCYLIPMAANSPWVPGDTLASAKVVNGVSLTGAQQAIYLSSGGAYTRYYLVIPSDGFLATCDSGGDSIYADTN